MQIQIQNTKYRYKYRYKNTKTDKPGQVVNIKCEAKSWLRKRPFGPPGTTLPVRQGSKFSIGDQEIRYQTQQHRYIKTNTNVNTNTIKDTITNTAGQFCQCSKDQSFQLEQEFRYQTQQQKI